MNIEVKNGTIEIPMWFIALVGFLFIPFVGWMAHVTLSLNDLNHQDKTSLVQSGIHERRLDTVEKTQASRIRQEFELEQLTKDMAFVKAALDQLVKELRK